MSISFQLPLALAALAALVIPLLLHLDRRRSLQTIRFAAMRWIGSGHPPQRSWRLIEWLLLLLRLLLIALLALWLAKPELLGDWRGPHRWLAVVPGVSESAIRASTANADQAVWLMPGFPVIDQEPLDQPTPATPNIEPQQLDPSAQRHTYATSSLLRQLDGELESADQLRVLVPSIVGGLDAQAIRLSRKIEWQVGSLATVAATQNEDAPSSSRQLAIRFDAAAETALPWLLAAISAWSTSPALAVNASVESIGIALGENIHAVIWLGAEPSADAMQRVRDGVTLLHAPSTATNVAVANGQSWPGTAQRLGRGQLIELATPLDPTHLPRLHDAGFATELHQRLFGYPALPDRAAAEHVTPTAGARDIPARRTDLRRWLGWLIAGAFVAERLLASGRRLRSAA